MEGNPVWSLPDYSNYVVSALPHLKVLDQQEITADLRANSAKWKNSEATVKKPTSFYYTRDIFSRIPNLRIHEFFHKKYLGQLILTNPDFFFIVYYLFEYFSR